MQTTLICECICFCHFILNKAPEEQNNLTAGNFIRLLILPKKQMVFVTQTRMLQVWSLN